MAENAVIINPKNLVILYLVNDDNYAIIVDDEFKKSLRIWIYSECLQNEIMVFWNNFINFTIDKLSK